MKKIKLAVSISALFFGIQVCAIELTECRIGAQNSTNKVKAECGTLSVAENRENPSRMIDLNIAIIRSKSIKKKTDAVIMLAGGPGQSAVESYPGAAHAFRGILKDRDVVLVDQRGTGESNPLKCDFDESLQEKLLEDESLYIPALMECVDKLVADTRFYTTTESIKDLEEVRKALSIDKWNLLGISYGTRKALTYVKMFPDSIRSVILDGVVPQQEALAQSHEKNLINALRKQFEQCEKQEACHETFGDVEEQMWQLFEKVKADKPIIKLQNYMTGEYEDVTLTKQSLAIAIRMFSYSAKTMALLPLMISKANHGHYETLAAQANAIGSILQEGMTNVELSIVCGEDVPFYRIEDANDNNIFGKDFLEKTQKSCDVWPHVNSDASFKEPVISDLPVLLLSGELDPVTPPKFAEITMKTLSHSQHLIAIGQGHNVFPAGCMPKIITQFIDKPEGELKTECLSDFNYEPFFINMMGPKQ